MRVQWWWWCTNNSTSIITTINPISELFGFFCICSTYETFGDDIKLCHWFPKSSLFIIVIKFDIKIVWNMKIGCGSWGPPLCRHLPTTTIGIISTLQNFRTKNNIPDICYKSLRKWKFHWWVDFRIYDGVPPFLEWIWRNPVFLSIGGEFMMSAHHMMGFHHMMCVLPIKW